MNVKSWQSVFMFKSLVFRIYIITLVLRLMPVILARGLGMGLDDMFQRRYDGVQHHFEERIPLARAGRFFPARVPAAGDI
jgi:hypothetical protein